VRRTSPDSGAGDRAGSPQADDPSAEDRCQYGPIAAGFRKEPSVTRHIYEIRVIGSFGPATSEAFADMVVQVEPTVTVLSADLDQPELHEVLDRVRALGLELIEIKQAATE
jgi:hypothetical protein